MLRTIFFAILVVFITGCVSNQSGIGSASGKNATDLTNADEDKFEDTPKKSSKKTEPLDVLDMSFDEAIDTALNIARDNFTNASYSDNSPSVSFSNTNFWLGDIRGSIEPIVVKDTASSDYGIVFDIESIGHGGNFSMIPGYAADTFFRELKNYITANSITVKKFTEYERIKDKGVPGFIKSSIPVGIESFQNFIDTKTSLKRYEGVWTDDRGEYTYGIVYDHQDSRYPYKAFVLESKHRNWKPGEIKIKFLKLGKSGISTSRYFAKNKSESGISWQVSNEAIVSINSPFRREFALVKIYPTKTDEGIFRGSGTAWLVSEDGVFVTNAHVIRDAERIYIGFKNNEQVEARVVAVDYRSDLALVKTEGPGNFGPPLPINFDPVLNGTNVVALGFPLTSTLGDDIRVTNGIISAQSGLQKDLTRYQISAAVQPGNSGGPIVDEYGNVVAITVSILKDSASSTGDVENVNFAIKAGYLRPLLNQAHVSPHTANTSISKSTVEVLQNFNRSVLPIYIE